MKDLRLELRFKNALLWNLIQESFPCPAESCRTRWTGVRAAAEAIGVFYGALAGLLSLGVSPFHRAKRKTSDGYQYTTNAEKIAALFKTVPETIFPVSLYRLGLPRVAVEEIESEHVLSLQEAQAMKLLPAYEMDAGDGERLKETIDAALSGLRPRQQQIIRKGSGSVWPTGPKQGQRGGA